MTITGDPLFYADAVADYKAGLAAWAEVGDVLETSPLIMMTKRQYCDSFLKGRVYTTTYTMLGLTMDDLDKAYDQACREMAE